MLNMKGSLKSFLSTCKSEELLQTPEGPIHISDPIGGLGLQFGFKSDTTVEKDDEKTAIWVDYFQGKFTNT